MVQGKPQLKSAQLFTQTNIVQIKSRLGKSFRFI